LALRAIILAAGRGTRLHPFTENCPKCLTELGGISLVQRQIETLRASNITDITIVTGYRDEMLAFPEIQTIKNEDWAATNMVESLFCAEQCFGDDLIISYGDIVYEQYILHTLLSSPHEISIIVDKAWKNYWSMRFDDPLDDAESLRTNNNGHITDIGNPVTNIADIQAQYIGLMRFKGNGVNLLRQAKKQLGETKRSWMNKRPLQQAYMTDLIMELILLGYDVNSVPIEGGWIEIDTVQDFDLATRMLADGHVTLKNYKESKS
jgi:L-glutamine-phosphate cytidylyltransferase